MMEHTIPVNQIEMAVREREAVRVDQFILGRQPKFRSELLRQANTGFRNIDPDDMGVSPGKGQGGFAGSAADIQNAKVLEPVRKHFIQDRVLGDARMTKVVE